MTARMVRRRRAEADRRGVVAELTARGESILRKLALYWLAELRTGGGRADIDDAGDCHRGGRAARRGARRIPLVGHVGESPARRGPRAAESAGRRGRRAQGAADQAQEDGGGAAR